MKKVPFASRHGRTRGHGPPPPGGLDTRTDPRCALPLSRAWTAESPRSRLRPRPQGWGTTARTGCPRRSPSRARATVRRCCPAKQSIEGPACSKGSDPTSAWRWLIHAHLVNARQEDTPPGPPGGGSSPGDSVSEQLLPGRPAGPDLPAADCSALWSIARPSRDDTGATPTESHVLWILPPVSLHLWFL